MISRELHARLIEKLERVIEIAEDHFGTTFEMPTIVYKQRGRTAGNAQCAVWKLDFNRVLFEENVEDFLGRTVPHEMAHLMDYQINPEGHRAKLKCYRRGRPIYKRDIHGVSWKQMMRIIGANPSRCHSYDVSTVSKKREKFTWICSVHGTEMKLGPKQHRTQMRTSGGWYTPRGTVCTRSCLSNFEYKGAAGRKIRLPVAIAADAPKSFDPNWTPHSIPGVSKKEQAAQIWRESGLGPAPRGYFIDRLVNELGMKRTTASTYHHNFKSGKWS